MVVVVESFSGSCLPCAVVASGRLAGGTEAVGRLLVADTEAVGRLLLAGTEAVGRLVGGTEAVGRLLLAGTEAVVGLLLGGTETAGVDARSDTTGDDASAVEVPVGVVSDGFATTVCDILWVSSAAFVSVVGAILVAVSVGGGGGSCESSAVDDTAVVSAVDTGAAGDVSVAASDCVCCISAIVDDTAGDVVVVTTLAGLLCDASKSDEAKSGLDSSEDVDTIDIVSTCCSNLARTPSPDIFDKHSTSSMSDTCRCIKQLEKEK